MDHQTEVYKEDEDVRGVIIINTQNESQVVVHDGIKISLIGIIGKDSLCYIFRVHPESARWSYQDVEWL